MKRAFFEEPSVEVIRFQNQVLTASGCGCYDPDFCPRDFKNCTSDGAVCTCGDNTNPALGNCV